MVGIVARTRFAKVETNRVAVHFPNVAVFAGTVLLPQEENDYAQRNRLGPKGSEHGRQYAAVFISTRHDRFFCQDERLLFRHRFGANSLRRRNEKGTESVHFRRKKMVGNRIQPQRCLEHFPFTPDSFGAGEPSDAKAVGVDRPNDFGELSKRRIGIRPLYR